MKRVPWILLGALLLIGGGFSSVFVLKDEGSTLGAITSLNFVGTPITCTVSGGAGTCTVTAGGGSFTATEITVDVGTLPVPGFTATVTDASVSGTSKVPAWQSGAAAGVSTIAFTSAVSTTCTIGALTCQVSPAFTTPGRTTVVAVTFEQDAPNVLSVIDAAGVIYSKRGTASGQGSHVELFTNFGSSSVASITATIDAVTVGPWFVSVGQYSGSAAMGSTVATANSNTSPATISITTQDTNNFVVSGISCSSSLGACTLASTTGNERTGGGGASSFALVDNTAALASSVTTAESVTGGGTRWSAVAIELRSAAKVADENDMDVLTCRTTPGTGTFTLYCDSIRGMLRGVYKIIYTIG